MKEKIEPWIGWALTRGSLAVGLYFSFGRHDGAAFRLVVGTVLFLMVVGLVACIAIVISCGDAETREDKNGHYIRKANGDTKFLKHRFYDPYIIRVRVPWTVQIVGDYLLAAVTLYFLDGHGLPGFIAVLALESAVVRFVAEQRAARFAEERLAV